jgi:hypothetical protein
MSSKNSFDKMCQLRQDVIDLDLMIQHQQAKLTAGVSAYEKMKVIDPAGFYNLYEEITAHEKILLRRKETIDQFDFYKLEFLKLLSKLPGIKLTENTSIKSSIGNESTEANYSVAISAVQEKVYPQSGDEFYTFTENFDLLFEPA